MMLPGVQALRESSEGGLTLGEGGKIDEVEVGSVRQQHAEAAGPGWEGLDNFGSLKWSGGGGVKCTCIHLILTLCALTPFIPTW